MGRTFLLLVVAASASCFVPAPAGWRAARTCGLRLLASMPSESQQTTETDVSQAAAHVSDLLDGEVLQEAPEGEMEDVLDQTLASMAAKAEQEAKREAARAEATKVASAVGELGMAVGMATGKTVLTIGAEAGKALFSSVVPDVSKIFSPKPAAKAEAPPAPDEMPLTEVAVEPVEAEPVEAAEEAFEADAMAASSVRVASEAPPSMDFSVEASANRLVEAAELELKAAKLKMESNAVVFAAETAARVKNLPYHIRDRAVDRVHGAQRQLDLELQAKRREKALLEKQVAAGNERLRQQLPTIGKPPPPPKPLTPLELIQERLRAASGGPSSSGKAVSSKKAFEMPFGLPKMATSAPTKRASAKRSAPKKKKRIATKPGTTTRTGGPRAGGKKVGGRKGAAPKKAFGIF